MKRLFVVLLLSSLTVTAQKLPNVQKLSIWAPGNVKIDGKATEWGEQYQAHNNATDAYYTLSNDEENIYLVLKLKNALVIDKIIKGSISITINHTLKKKDGQAVTVAYPALKRIDGGPIASMLMSRIGVHSDNDGVDNSMERLNSLMSTRSKNIKVQGIKSIQGSDISVYNEEGIKVASRFERPIVYIYELAIPIKYLDLPNNGNEAFSYNIKMNVEDERSNSYGPAPTTGAPASSLGPPPPPARASVATTDLWGEYTLAKKP